MSEKVQHMKRHDDLEDAVKGFADAMLAKLFRKQNEGWKGWNHRKYTREFQKRLMEHAIRGDPVDVANFAMFLWNMNQKTWPQEQDA